MASLTFSVKSSIFGFLLLFVLIAAELDESERSSYYLKFRRNRNRHPTQIVARNDTNDSEEHTKVVGPSNSGASCYDSRMTSIINTGIRNYSHDMGALSKYILDQIARARYSGYYLVHAQMINGHRQGLEWQSVTNGDLFQRSSSHGCYYHDTQTSVADFEHGSGEGMQYNLNNFIIKEKVVCLNESTEGSGVRVFKSWDDRNDRTNFVDSDVDEELLFYIPFKGHVKVSGITLMGDLGDSHPSNVQVFKDKENMSFDEVSKTRPIQEMQLKQDDSAQIDYPLIASKFSSVSSLSLYFNSNFGADSTRIYYIGIRGEYERDFRDKVVIATYEARPVPDDHKAEIPDAAHHHIC